MEVVLLKGRSAIVTGSTSGIGLGIAERLAANGANITLNGLGDATEIEGIRAKLAQEFGVEVRYDDANLMQADAVHGLVESATKAFGHVDILINNAGMQFTARTEVFPPSRWDAVIALNLTAAFHSCQAILPQLYERNWGRIINIASAHGLVASKEKSAYVASKHGLLGLTKVIALESAETGVTCNAICPGWVLTPMVQAQIEARAEKNSTSFEIEKKALLEEKQPSGEFVTTKQLGDLAVFLCSDAADQMRGQALSVDGGWTIQ